MGSSEKFIPTVADHHHHQPCRLSMHTLIMYPLHIILSISFYQKLVSFPDIDPLHHFYGISA